MLAGEYYSTGKFNDQEKAAVAGVLDTVTDANMKFRKSVVDMHNAGVVDRAAYLGVAQALVNSMPNDPAALHYYSQDSATKYAVVLSAVKAALLGVQTTIGKAKGGGQ